ncbi:MAG: hypothetical protein VX663_04340 [Pseudomonadota bacterium]|nr:hypothetical protein [Pseudomonadota bacterium]
MRLDRICDCTGTLALLRRISIGMVAVTAVLFAASALAQTDVDAQKLRAAKRDFMKYCSTCHGEEGRGDGPYTRMFRVYPVDLRLLSLNNDGKFPYDYVRQIIDGRKDVRAHGARTMPVWFDELWSSPEGSGARQALDRIKALTDYLADIQLNPDE